MVDTRVAVSVSATFVLDPWDGGRPHQGQSAQEFETGLRKLLTVGIGNSVPLQVRAKENILWPMVMASLIGSITGVLLLSC